MKTKNAANKCPASQLSQRQQAWLWMIYKKRLFGYRADWRSLGSLERRFFIITERDEFSWTAYLTLAGEREAQKIDAWREAECDRLTAEEEAGKAQQELKP